MSIAKVTEISCASKTSFEDAIEKGIERADKTLDSDGDGDPMDDIVKMGSGLLGGLFKS
jgi:hypothetical protein